MHKTKNSVSFNPRKIVERIREGKYAGEILDVTSSNDSTKFWVQIAIICYDCEDSNLALEVHNEYCNMNFQAYFTSKDVVFNNFAYNYTDNAGFFVPEKLVGTFIDFEVATREINGRQYSKITAIEESENVFPEDYENDESYEVSDCNDDDDDYDYEEEDDLLRHCQNGDFEYIDNYFRKKRDERYQKYLESDYDIDKDALLDDYFAE
jgi:hypothetical protein